MGYCWLIWDWNGTLLDDAWLSVEVMSQLRLSRGLAPIDGQQYQELFGFPLQDYCVRLGFASGDFKTLSAEFSQRYEARRLECQLQSGALPLLESLRQAGMGQAVLSAYQQSLLTQIVVHYGLQPYFAAVAGLDNPYAEGKAARGRRLLEELGWDRSQVLLVGDTDHDHEVAQALGVDCALFPSGHQHPRRLRECGVPLVQRLEEVRDLLDLESGRRR
ncbi:MAG: HAD family hydrolase [Candidatus Latescibacteria bacterium]|nr:HAD family hydrolase [Candidatus Latescibacterota bacterium]